MPADPALHVELERLADVAHREIEACRGSAATPYSAAARAACAAITARLVEAGVQQVIAEWATTDWIVAHTMGATVWECVERADYHAELGLIRP